MTQAVSGKIQTVGVNRSLNAAWFQFNGTRSGTYTGPDPNAASFFALNLAQAFDVEMYRALIAAELQGLPVSVGGSDSFIGSWEIINAIGFNPPV